ncbi:hypothetical protein WDL1P1_00324 (plasmid) [Variovorax sp. WDL1]|uniref:hypothetical protein n=1 Tax=unclassified Variovorax TaxID=663243 RepID=UPI00076C92A1|nr:MULTISPECIES: hypothetical protein [unclassified Variovorax]KWT98224.1 hypothetical protein APY03_0895 [Variovorax sp. WDL1]VTU42641.1 hypothetical protein E5P1_00312 [Variovorax sp. PBL-E5]VTU42616.1 hypothetical protein SRS16P1_00314 [Variovorax sp. SRS16]VTU43887.1 hypothetical protein H6P1_00615 [Variovorax sp. PBL-H6]VTV17359.1 hypothetical protein WDL1P1_00324 [Variovorax sp. WDL1]
MLITQQEVEALAQKRGLVLEFPKAWALNKWDIELVKPQPEGTKPPAEPRKVLQTNNVGDLCRFLGKDGYTEMAGKQIRRTEPTIFHLWHHDGTLLHKFTGPVALMRD